MDQPHTTEKITPAERTHRSRIGATWLALGAFVILAILMVVFISQNNTPVDFEFFNYNGSIPFGIAMIIAAIVGSLLTLLVGTVRIIQLKMAARKH